MDDFYEFMDYVEDEGYVRMPRNIIRDMENPLEKYNNNELLKRYRFSRETIQHILLNLVYPAEPFIDQRGLTICPITKLCVALRFYASGSIQRVIGDTGSMSQTTVHRIIQEVSENLARNLRQYVKFPDCNGMNNNRNLFFEIGGFPGVSGCVDGTHIEIKNPGGENAEVFRNRKGWMSLNIQVIAGPRCEILDIVIRWPGSAHDSRIFNNSAVRLRFEQELLTGLLLGDSAYQQTHYLFTPVLNPATRAQNLYNNAHIRTRNVVERTFGIWKSRFRCLATCLQYKLRNVVRIIAATAVLHNIAILRGEQHVQEDFVDRVVDGPPVAVIPARGNAIRAAFIQRHFNI
ncbi:hypothetical protein MML48_1g04984 [Holotrichia oblita]|uniref:Uncharacterized protein n=1 Tax=Holotrichia oblita TaxID=644536 RepID=A0ACB9TS41_HOLOL|nr:hypothetical protein MML48_1g04984 [Holotrichia oblita]